MCIMKAGDKNTSTRLQRMSDEQQICEVTLRRSGGILIAPWEI